MLKLFFAAHNMIRNAVGKILPPGGRLTNTILVLLSCEHAELKHTELVPTQGQCQQRYAKSAERKQVCRPKINILLDVSGR